MRRDMNEIIVKDDIIIEDLIYEIRGKQVMLDSDLANLYDVETKRINEAVKNNPDKFPERFSWILTEEEWIFLRSKISTLENHGKGRHRKYLPRVFTEQGVAMLATILKSRVASSISIAIMDAFVFMRHYLNENKDIYLTLNNINNKLTIHDDKLKLLFSKFEENKINEIYFSGQIYDAFSKIKDILKEAKKDIIIIDAYADKVVLDIIKDIKVNITLIVKTKTLLTSLDINRYNSQYNNLTIKYNDSFHDRYFILDNNKIYHCGTSINRIGSKTFSINIIEDKPVKELLLKEVKRIIG